MIEMSSTLLDIYLAELGTERSRDTQKQALDTMAHFLDKESSAQDFPWHEIQYQHVQLIRSHLSKTYKPATCNRMLSALRGILKSAFMLDRMSADDYLKAASVKNLNGNSSQAGRELSLDEIKRVLDVCSDDESPAGRRDAAMLIAMYPGGLRRDEVSNLTYKDIDVKNKAIRVHGKGNKERIVPIEDEKAISLLTDWMNLRGKEPGALFWPINKGGQFYKRKMSNQAVYNMILKRLNQAGIENFSPQDLRRSTATHMLDEGADLNSVADVLGHANLNTTAIYDKRGERAKRRASRLLHV